MPETRIATHVVNGKSRETPTFISWKNMIARCTSPKDKCYKIYGGRGIWICERWKTFRNFYEDMGQRPAGKSLDRIDVNDGYYEKNCRWATTYEQANNARTNHKISFHGTTMNMRQWERELGLTDRAIKDRLALGWSIERAMTTPSPNQSHCRVKSGS